MEVDKPFAVQFVHDMHFRHHLFSWLLGYLQELCSVFSPRALLFNFLHNAKFTPEEDNKSCLPVYPWGVIWELQNDYLFLGNGKKVVYPWEFSGVSVVNSSLGNGREKKGIVLNTVLFLESCIFAFSGNFPLRHRCFTLLTLYSPFFWPFSSWMDWYTPFLSTFQPKIINAINKSLYLALFC